jgi:hypothetical protein
MLRIRPDFLLVFVLFVVPYSLAQNPSNALVSSGVQNSNHSHILGQPLAFEANRGQAPAGVDFVARGQGYSAQLKANRLILGVSRPANNASGEKARSENEVVEIDLAGGNGNARSSGEDKMPGYSNYLLGSKSADWITGVEHYAQVRYADVYPGIDLVFHGNQSRLEHDFVIQPGANPAQIGLTFSGVREMKLQRAGDLRLKCSRARCACKSRGRTRS